MIKILITVEGGIVQSICASEDVRIMIIDYDLKADDPDDTVLISEVLYPDVVTKESFHETLFNGEPMTEEDKRVKEILKHNNF